MSDAAKTETPPRSRALQAGWRLWAADFSGQSWTDGDRVRSLEQVIELLDAEQGDTAT